MSLRTAAAAAAAAALKHSRRVTSRHVRLARAKAKAKQAKHLTRLHNAVPRERLKTDSSNSEPPKMYPIIAGVGSTVILASRFW